MDTARVILVTGAASGIGRATALLFAQRGWTVLANDLRADALETLAQQAQGRLLALPGDVATRAGATAIAEGAAALADGRLDALFNCAGLIEMGPHAGLDPARVDRLLAVNVHGVLHCIDALRPLLRHGRDAHIVNMGSASAEYGVPELAAYSASKFFVRGLSEALNLEFEAEGIQLSVVVAAYVATPMIHGAERQAGSVRRLGTRLTAEAVAETVWRAVHGRRSVWHVGRDARLTHWAVRLLGARSRWLVGRLARD